MEGSLDRTVPVMLLWAEDGAHPTAEQFEAASPHPTLGPEAWSLLEMAVAYALNTSRDDGCVPWIRVGDEIIGPDRLQGLHAASAENASA